MVSRAQVVALVELLLAWFFSAITLTILFLSSFVVWLFNEDVPIKEHEK